MRVTSRRLRATLQAFPMIVPPAATRHLRDELRWLATALGTARDTEVLVTALRAMLAGTPTELRDRARRGQGHGPLRAPRGRGAPGGAQRAGLARYFALLDELEGLLAAPPQAAAATAPASEILPDAVGRACRRTRRRMLRAWQAPPGPARDAMLHETRKAAKRARYAAEAARPAIGKEARRLAKRMKAVQSALGDHHDAVTAGAAAREMGIAAHLAGENAFTFGLLNGYAHHRALTCEHQARKAWKRAARSRCRLPG